MPAAGKRAAYLFGEEPLDLVVPAAPAALNMHKTHVSLHCKVRVSGLEEFATLVHPRLGARIVAAGVLLVDCFGLAVFSQTRRKTGS